MKKESINIIVPYGHSPTQPEREDRMRFVVKACLAAQTFQERTITLVEASSSPTQEDFAKEHCDDYLFLPTPPGTFSVGKVQNAGYSLGRDTSHLYIHQADFLLQPDALETSMNTMHATGAPLVFPFFSAVSISKPVSEGITSGQVDWARFYDHLTDVNADVRRQIAQDGPMRRYQLRPDELARFDDVLPQHLQPAALAQLPPHEIWGEDDGQFSYFDGFYDVGSASDLYVNYRPHAKASASYLADSDAYAQTGGPPTYVGWGGEDLGFWGRVQTVFDYAEKDHNIVFRGQPLNGDVPLAHLWHATSGNRDYYKTTGENLDAVAVYMARPIADRLAEITPLQRGTL